MSDTRRILMSDTQYVISLEGSGYFSGWTEETSNVSGKEPRYSDDIKDARILNLGNANHMIEDIIDFTKSLRRSKLDRVVVNNTE